MTAETTDLVIKRNISRADQKLLRNLDGVPTGWVTDAQDGRGALMHSIRPITRNHHFVGSAICIETRPLYNMAVLAVLPHLQPNDVVVVATGGSDEAACFGDFMTGMARNCGAVGLVTDGLVRDLAGLNQVGVPVFARGLSPNPPFRDDGPGRIGFAVTIGGLEVKSGDVVVGDSDGVVVLPQSDLHAVLKRLDSVRAKEKEAEAMVRAGRKSLTGLIPALAAKSVHYVD
ncbi:MAG: RraA family protein [Dongiaceae bacterium]